MLIRLAKLDDIPEIELLMKRSMKTLGKGHYSEEQIDSCCRFVCVPDKQLIEDQTFYVVFNESGEMIGCGGWSYRNKLYAGPSDTAKVADPLDPARDPARIRAMFVDPAYSGKGVGSLILKEAEAAALNQGFTKGALGSTVSGHAFYKKKGWADIEDEQATLPDGISIRVISMNKSLS